MSTNPFPNDKYYTLPNSKFADDNFTFDENGLTLSQTTNIILFQTQSLQTTILHLIKMA